VREVLINVIKHAKGHKVKVSIRRIRAEIHVCIEDDGIGFDPARGLPKAAKEGAFGLFSIRERLKQLGGHLKIDSAPEQGCRVTMTAPLECKETDKGGQK
jgi:signal transduction histidine kinase